MSRKKTKSRQNKRDTRKEKCSDCGKKIESPDAVRKCCDCGTILCEECGSADQCEQCFFEDEQEED